jgi:hypothetical protein
MKTRKGKIARLPKETRDVVNMMIRDGATYQQINQMLEKHDCFGVGEQNLTNWREGGYQDWLKEQERLEDMRAKREFALEVVRQNEGSKIHEATLQLAASQLYEVITEFDLGGLKGLLREQPENYARLVNSLAKLSQSGLEYEKYREGVRAAKEAIQAKLATAKGGGLAPETISFIEEKLGLM